MPEAIFNDPDLQMAYENAAIERARELVEAAQQYERAGYVTFPLDAELNPAITDFNRLSLPRDEKEWRNRWWNRVHSPNCGLGLSTSSNIFIIDIDSKHEGSTDGYFCDDYGVIMQGQRLLDWLDNRYGLAGVPISQTPSGGYHLIYSGEGYDWSQVLQQQDFWTPFGKMEADTRPPFKGYSREWPTVNAKGTYKWIQPLPHKRFLPKLPEELFGWFKEYKDRRDAEYGYNGPCCDFSDFKRIGLVEGDKATAALYRHTLEYIERKYPMEKGHRNEYLLPIANDCYWGAGLTEKLTRIIVSGWAEMAWKKYGERVPAGAVEARMRATKTFKPYPFYVGFLRRQLHMD